MATIVIKDLLESVDLDRQAMTAILGGSRMGGRQSTLGRTLLRNDRIFNYSGSFARRQPAGGVERPGSRLIK